MSYEPAYVEVDGAWHEVAEEEHTACGLVIPYPGTLTHDLPAKVHCGANATKEAPKAEAAPVAKAPAPAKAKAKK